MNNSQVFFLFLFFFNSKTPICQTFPRICIAWRNIPDCIDTCNQPHTRCTYTETHSVLTEVSKTPADTSRYRHNPQVAPHLGPDPKLATGLPEAPSMPAHLQHFFWEPDRPCWSDQCRTRTPALLRHPGGSTAAVPSLGAV